MLPPFLAATLWLLSQDPGSAFAPAVWGLELPVRDVAAAERGYTAGLGFRARLSGGEFARLEKDGLALVLVRSDAPAAPAGSAALHLNLAARDLALALERALAAGFEAPEGEFAIPLGRAVAVVDANGNRTHLIALDAEIERVGAHDGLALFNVGLNLERGAEREFVERLGFRVPTREHLPAALPTEKAGAAALVLHDSATSARPAGTRSAALLLEVPTLEPALAALAAIGFAQADALPRATPFGRRAALRVPSGLRVELLERSPQQLAFERLCALAGSWEGRSSAGWTSRSEIEVIARGSAVLERTNFEAHPGETMLTLFHRDGAELVLTHYCVAGNQPRLVASKLEPDSLHFTFRDATNLASRDQGHMDEAVFTLEGPEAFSSKWSFFQAGKTSWMEEIRYRRVAPGAAALPASAGDENAPKHEHEHEH